MPIRLTFLAASLRPRPGRRPAAAPPARRAAPGQSLPLPHARPLHRAAPSPIRSLRSGKGATPPPPLADPPLALRVPCHRSYSYSGSLSSTTFTAAVGTDGACTTTAETTTKTDKEWVDSDTALYTPVADQALGDFYAARLAVIGTKRSSASTAGASIAIAVLLLILSVASTSHFLRAHNHGGTTYFPPGQRACCCCDCGTCKLGDPCTAMGLLVGAKLGEGAAPPPHPSPCITGMAWASVVHRLWRRR
jgi:hypothetical protein